MYDLILKHAVLVTDSAVFPGAVGVKDGKIAAIGEVADDGAPCIDVRGQYLFPGLIDCHVHFNQPGFDSRETFDCASSAAAVGGVTTVLDMPLNNRPATSTAARMEAKKQLIAGHSWVDYALYGALFPACYGDLAEMHAHGAVAFKGFTCDDSALFPMQPVEALPRAFAALKPFDGLAALHCEDDVMCTRLAQEKIAAGHTARRDYLDSRPPEAEVRAVRAALAAAEQSGARLHICHVSHPDAAQLIREAKARGVRVTAETCPQYLLLTEQDVLTRGMVCKCSPPMRTAEARDRLWDYLLDGTIDCLCSDHSPAPVEEKDESGPRGAFGAWGGLSGVQTTVMSMFDAIVHQKGASPCVLAQKMGSRPAEIFGLDRQKGRLAVGMDADFTCIDPERSWEIRPEDMRYKHKLTPFAGCRGRGAVTLTVLRGSVVYRDGVLSAVPEGKLLR